MAHYDQIWHTVYDWKYSRPSAKKQKQKLAYKCITLQNPTTWKSKEDERSMTYSTLDMRRMYKDFIHVYMRNVADVYKNWDDAITQSVLFNMFKLSCPYNIKYNTKLRTQKARGVNLITQYYGAELFSTKVARLSWIADYATYHDHPVFGCANTMFKDTEFFAHLCDYHDQWFARPCPTIPRHGFVDSRTIAGVSDLRIVLEETLYADGGGEVIFAPYIDAVWSGILTNGGVTLGAGHEGATSGEDSITIPAPSVSTDLLTCAILGMSRLSNNTLEKAGLNPNEGVFAELVHGKVALLDKICEDAGKTKPENTTELVQLRGGPKIELTQDWVPEDMAVEQVIDAQGNLLVWETKMAELRGAKGAVVAHIGGNLASHYAVHAILNNIPIVTSFDPHVGDKIFATDSVLSTDLPLKARRDVVRCLNGLDTRRCLNFGEESAHLALATFHTMIAWPDLPHLNRLRAWGLIALIRHIAAACAAEDRHFDRRGPASWFAHLEENVDYDLDELDGEVFEKSNLNIESDVLARGKSRRTSNTDTRSMIYDAALQLTIDECLDVLQKTYRDFTGKWCDNYGGPSWANGAKAGIELCKATKALMKSQNQENWNNLVAKWNNACNAAHNNGKLLNKWIDKYWIYDHTPQVGLASTLVYNIVSDPQFTPSAKHGAV